MKSASTGEGASPFLGITMGDPAGIGPEVIAKALAGATVRRLCRPLGHRLVSGYAAGGQEPETQDERDSSGGSRRRCLHGRIISPCWTRSIIPLGGSRVESRRLKLGRRPCCSSRKPWSLRSLSCIDGIVTAPINKEAINMAGCHFPGHTELLADLTKTQESGMMIVGGPLRIMFVTTHVAIKELPSLLTQAKIEKAIRLAHLALRDLFGIKKPRVGVAALNPHAGEHGLFGDEEARVILPAARAAQAQGIRASDPLPADTLFGKAARGDYDGVVALYHDQGLIPLKLVAFGTCVNLTVGLPIIRTSVDHGTAFDIVGKGIADPGSLVEAITLAATLAEGVGEGLSGLFGLSWFVWLTEIPTRQTRYRTQTNEIN